VQTLTRPHIFKVHLPDNFWKYLKKNPEIDCPRKFQKDHEKFLLVAKQQPQSGDEKYFHGKSS
jgi:hypothetical protein